MKKVNIALHLSVISIGILLTGCESPDVTEVTKQMEELGLSSDAET